MLGAVPATLQTLRPEQTRRLGLESHERFQVALEAEVERARAFGRTLAMVMVKGEPGAGGTLGRWYPHLQERLRAFDSVALYGPDTLEVLLPEIGAAGAAEIVAAMIEGGIPLRCGIGSLPDHAGTADELAEVVRRALQRCTRGQPVVTAERSTAGRAQVHDGGPQPVVDSPAMQAIFETLPRLGNSVIPVLIQGETGTGKEVVARAIHGSGKRSGGPMVCVNCGAIPSQLLESTLFGHERGAFTGAHQRSKGVFESAAGGTVLLDEIGELPLQAQAALLRVLESQRVTRVGSVEEVPVDVRVLAATHRDLEAMSRDGGFRLDLYFRLNAMTLVIPPLRERTEEIAPLLELFLGQANRANERQVQGVERAAMDLLRRYSWPGNVRELRNAVERAVVIARLDEVRVEDLPEPVRAQAHPEPLVDDPAATDTGEAEIAGGDGGLRAELERFEAQRIRKALQDAGWRRKVAARELGLPLRTLARKVQVYGITED